MTPKLPDLRKCPKFIRKWIEKAIAWARLLEPLAGIGISINDTPSGKMISIKSAAPGSIGAGIPAYLPFTVLTQQNQNVANIWQKGVVPISYLYYTRDTNSVLNITGFLSNSTPNSSDAGWTNISSTDKVWLEIPVVSLAPNGTISIKSLGAGSNFGGGAVENDGGTGSPVKYIQTFARLPIATLTLNSNAAGEPIVRQIVMSHRILKNSPQSSLSAAGANSAAIAAIYPEAI